MKALDRQVSIYKNVYDKIGKTICLRDFLLSYLHKSEIEVVRRTADKQQRNKLKKELPLVTISGVFKPTRKAENLVAHTGLICIDIDKQDNLHISNYNNLKEQIAGLKEVLFCATSASGQGLYCIIPIMYPSKHIEHFRALEQDWLTYGIVIDKNCKDITRMRGYSYDATPYINEEAIMYSKIRKPKQVIYSEMNQDNTSKVEKIAQELYSKGINIAENYDDWFLIGRALAHELGESGRRYFHALSSLSTKYNVSECDKKFDLCKRTHTSSLGSFFILAKAHGVSLNI